ncbi:MAG: SH3 domain-containing protein [Nitrospinae bacterium]|nr:SH3 domain-containing protein [Nitrospinota bacterium]
MLKDLYKPVITVFFVIFLSGTPFAHAETWNENFNPPRIFQTMQDVNFRSCADSKCGRMGAVKRGQQIKVTRMVKGWYEVPLANGSYGYIYKKFLKQVSSSAPRQPQAPTNSRAINWGKPISCFTGSINYSGANMRDGYINIYGAGGKARILYQTSYNEEREPQHEYIGSFLGEGDVKANGKNGSIQIQRSHTSNDINVMCDKCDFDGETMSQTDC